MEAPSQCQLPLPESPERILCFEIREQYFRKICYLRAHYLDTFAPQEPYLLSWSAASVPANISIGLNDPPARDSHDVVIPAHCDANEPTCYSIPEGFRHFTVCRHPAVWHLGHKIICRLPKVR